VKFAGFIQHSHGYHPASLFSGEACRESFGREAEMDILEAGPLDDLGRAMALGAKVVKSAALLGGFVRRWTFPDSNQIIYDVE